MDVHVSDELVSMTHPNPLWTLERKITQKMDDFSGGNSEIGGC